jgi:hypothetical protein
MKHFCPNCNKSDYFECDGKTNGYCRACNKKSPLADFYEDDEKEEGDAFWNYIDDWVKEHKG